MTLGELLSQYVANPDHSTLTPLQQAVMDAANYDPLVLIETRLNPLFEASDHQGIIDLLHRQMPGLFLSPTVHAYLSQAHQELGDETGAQRERQAAQLAMQTLISSGNGSHEKPYRVLRVSDEYDVLTYLEATSTSQRTVDEDNRVFDVLTTTDGTEVWFKLLWRNRGAAS